MQTISDVVVFWVGALIIAVLTAMVIPAQPASAIISAGLVVIWGYMLLLRKTPCP